IALDERKQIWVATGDGLARIRNPLAPAGQIEIESFETRETKIVPTEEFAHVRQLSRDRLWVSDTLGNVFRIRDDGRDVRLELVVDSELTKGETVRAFAETPDGTTWIGCEVGPVLRSEGAGWVKEKLPDPQNGVRVLAVSPKGDLWSASWRSLSIRTSDGWKKIAAPPNDSSWSVGFTPGGKLWVGGGQGIYERAEKIWNPIHYSSSDGANMFRAFRFSSDSKSVWVCHRGGVIRGRRRPWQPLTTTSTNSRLRSNSFCMRPEEPPVCAGARGTIFEYRSGTWKALLPTGADPKNLYLVARSDSELYGVDPTTFFEISLERREVTGRIALPEGIKLPGEKLLPRLFLTSNGEAWILAERDAFALRGDEFVALRPGGPRAPDSFLRSISEASDGSFYVAYQNALERWSGDRLEDVTAKFEALRGTDIEAVFCARDGTVWIGTDGSGLFAIKDGEIEQFTREDGLAINLVNVITETKNGDLWIAYRNIGLGVRKGSYWINYTYRHGLPIQKKYAIGEYPAGTMWTAVAHSGLRRLVPDGNGPDTFIRNAPAVVSENGEGVFSFSARDAWDRTPREDLRYSWRIVGSDASTEWSSFSTSTSVSTPDGLLPGDYEFQVRSIDLDGNVAERAASQNFTVEPPVWSRPAVYIPLVGLGLLAFVMFLVSIRASRVFRESQRKYEATTRKIDRRLELETLLSSSSSDVLDVPAEKTHSALVELLQRLGRFLDTLGTGLVEIDANGSQQRLAAYFDRATRGDEEQKLTDLAAGELETLRSGDPLLRVRTVNGRVRTELVIPYQAPEVGLAGYLEFAWRGDRSIVSDGTIEGLRPLSTIVSNALLRWRSAEERRKLEEQLQQSRKMQALGTLAAGVAHDFNNILTAIMGYADLAAESPHRSDLDRAIEGVQEASRKATTITRSLLTFSRRSSAEKTPTHLYDALEPSRKILERVLP
ncbi:MAG: histidine kinase dimerization/phospho-acceptor domain-containing protein, partial [Planctomycetota bacterium]